MKLYLKALKLHFKSLLEYRASLITSLIAQSIIIFSYYFVILALFDKFGNIKGFTLYEVLLCFGIIQTGFSFNEIFARGIDNFDKLIIRGDFDRILLRPKSLILQVLCSDINFIKVARIIQTGFILALSISKLNITWNIYKVITLILMLISAVCIFFSIFLFAASYCFFTVQGLEFRNLLTDGGKHMAQYPIGIFNKGFRFVFTFLIPYAFVNYYPLLYFLGKTDNVLYAFSPLIVVLFIIPGIIAFYLGSKRYASVGS